MAVNMAALFINRFDWSSVRDQIRQSGLVRDFETQLQVREASTIEALVSGNVIKDSESQVIGYVLLIKDITEQKKTERALVKEKRTIEGILEGSPIATFVMDRSHRVIHWNKACELLTGKKPGELIGTNNQWQAFYPNPRPILADGILEEDYGLLKQYYGDKGLRSRPLSPGPIRLKISSPPWEKGGGRSSSWPLRSGTLRGGSRRPSPPCRM